MVLSGNFNRAWPSYGAHNLLSLSTLLAIFNFSAKEMSYSRFIDASFQFCLLFKIYFEIEFQKVFWKFLVSAFLWILVDPLILTVWKFHNLFHILLFSMIFGNWKLGIPPSSCFFHFFLESMFRKSAARDFSFEFWLYYTARLAPPRMNRDPSSVRKSFFLSWIFFWCKTL